MSAPAETLENIITKLRSLADYARIGADELEARRPMHSRLKAVEVVCSTLCKSGRFETGEGTCTAMCMDQLGDARRDCSHKIQTFGSLAVSILTALDNT